MRTKTRKKIKRLKLIKFTGLEVCSFCEGKIDMENLWDKENCCACYVVFLGCRGINFETIDTIPLWTIIIVGELNE